MARRAFIGANRRTDGIRRKMGRAEITPGGRTLSNPVRIDQRAIQDIVGSGGRPDLRRDTSADDIVLRPIELDRDDSGDNFKDPRDPGVPIRTPIPQTLGGFPVDIRANRPGSGDVKGDEIISDVDLKEIEKERDLILFPPPPPPRGPFIEDLPDFKPVKTGLGVIGSGGVKDQEI